MSRLADALSATLSARPAATPANATPISREEPPSAAFHAIFAQELFAQEANAIPGAQQVTFTLPAESESLLGREVDEKSIDKNSQAASEDTAELAAFLPLVLPPAATPASLTPGERVLQRDAPMIQGKSNAVLLAAAHAGSDLPMDGSGTSPAFATVAATKEVAVPNASMQTLAAAPTSTLAGESSGGKTQAIQIQSDPGTPVTAPPLVLASAQPSATLTGVTTVATPFGASVWQEDFAQQVVLVGKRDLSTAQIKLNPAELGPIEVNLSIKNDRAEASFSAASAPVREAIEAALPRLREMFAEAGITLGNATVSQDLGQAKQAFTQGEFGQAQRHGEEGHPAETDARADTNLAVVRKRSLGLIDTFA